MYTDFFLTFSVYKFIYIYIYNKMYIVCVVICMSCMCACLMNILNIRNVQKAQKIFDLPVANTNRGFSGILSALPTKFWGVVGEEDGGGGWGGGLWVVAHFFILHFLSSNKLQFIFFHTHQSLSIFLYLIKFFPAGQSLTHAQAGAPYTIMLYSFLFLKKKLLDFNFFILSYSYFTNIHITAILYSKVLFFL